MYSLFHSNRRNMAWLLEKNGVPPCNGSRESARVSVRPVGWSCRTWHRRDTFPSQERPGRFVEDPWKWAMELSECHPLHALGVGINAATRTRLLKNYACRRVDWTWLHLIKVDWSWFWLWTSEFGPQWKLWHLCICLFISIFTYFTLVVIRVYSKEIQKRKYAHNRFSKILWHSSFNGHILMEVMRPRSGHWRNVINYTLMRLTPLMIVQSSPLRVTPSGQEKSVTVSKCHSNHILFDA